MIAASGSAARPIALALALPALLLSTSELMGDRLLARGVRAGSAEQVGWAALLQLRSARALRHQAALLMEADPDRAGALALQAVRKDPSPSGWMLVGRAAMRALEPARAIPAFQEAVRLHPRLFAGHFALARVYEEAGDRASAIRHAARARSLRPGDARLRWLPR